MYKAKRVAALKMLDSGFEDKVKARRDLKDKGKRRREEDKSNNVEKREMKRKQKMTSSQS